MMATEGESTCQTNKQPPKSGDDIGPSGDDEIIKARLELLYTVGKRVEGTSAAVDINQKPDYYDAERVSRAQRALHKYYTSISMASTAGLVLLLQCECILVPLLRTGKSRTVVDLYDRYTATVKYVRKYYETNFVDPKSEGWRYLNLVRTMHQRIYKQMNGEPKPTRGEEGGGQASPGGEVWVNQYDMALTQFAFIGLFVVAPDKCAAYSVGERELADIVYFWRLLSYYFGIEERFNLFVYHDELPKQTRLLSLLLEHQRGLIETPPTIPPTTITPETPTTSHRHPTGLAMARGFLLAFEGLAKEATFGVLDHWWRPVVSLSGEPRATPLRGWEHLKQVQFHLYFKLLFRSDTLMSFINEKYKKKFDKFIEKSDKNRRKLAKKYGSLVYE